jgi:hypothetical protein
MKNLFYSIMLFLATPFITTSQSFVYIDTNHFKALIPSTPLLFTEGNTSAFNIPKTGVNGTIYNSTVWMGGLSNGNLHLAAETYRQMGMDFQSGPIANQYNNPAKWDVVKVTKKQIEKHQTDTASWNNLPSSFLLWPAHGDTTNGEAFNLAPFVNIGGNPLFYEPELGDYPSIKGDMCTYYIFNDGRLHTETGGNQLGVEIHRMAYSYADTNSFLHNSVFVDYKIINRSSNSYNNFIFSAYTDFDIGKYNDDFIGTDTSKNMVFAYNGASTDAGYGSNPPAQGLIWLNQKIGSSMFYNNETSNMGNPDTAPEYYQYMQSIWLDSSMLKYGGNGKTGTENTKYAFSGNPCSLVGINWTENSAGNTAGDRRKIASTEKLVFNPNDTLHIEMAYLFARGSNGNFSSVCELQNEASKLIDWYKNKGTTTSTNKINLISPSDISIYPNPTNGNVSIQSSRNLHRIELYSLNGKLVFSIENPQHTIHVDALYPGIYILKAIDETGTTTKKILVN